MEPDLARPAPDHAIWELTWRCNLRCTHCLVEGGPNELVELSPEEALDLVDQLADLGVRRITLTGGEPFFRKDWLAISRRIRHHGIDLIFSCNGHLVRDQTLAQLLELETRWVALSLDGMSATHDTQRRFPEENARLSSFAIVEAAIRRLVPTPIRVAVITSVSADNLDELPALHGHLKALGVDEWMVQLAHPQGRFAQEEQAASMLPRQHMPELAAFLSAASRDPVLPPLIHHTIGWLSRDEPRLRSSGRPHVRKRRRPVLWRGTPCGVNVVAFEPDGGVKGCPNQVGDPFVVGNVRKAPLRQIWEELERWHWVRPRSEQLKGVCAPCNLAEHCGGGCPCMAWDTTGHLFDNPWCLRAIERESQPSAAEPAYSSR
jgi:radical SAM protein with 4Fe4S-binding SPASM domain